jgi:hypothetical protein
MQCALYQRVRRLMWPPLQAYVKPEDACLHTLKHERAILRYEVLAKEAFAPAKAFSLLSHRHCHRSTTLLGFPLTGRKILIPSGRLNRW